MDSTIVFLIIVITAIVLVIGSLWFYNNKLSGKEAKCNEGIVTFFKDARTEFVPYIDNIAGNNANWEWINKNY